MVQLAVLKKLTDFGRVAHKCDALFFLRMDLFNLVVENLIAFGLGTALSCLTLEVEFSLFEVPLVVGLFLLRVVL